jgi:hypothetical protein
MFKKYRILEVNGKFIPQCKLFLFDTWDGIEDNNIKWYVFEYQLEYCSKPTIEEARAKIHKY